MAFGPTILGYDGIDPTKMGYHIETKFHGKIMEILGRLAIYNINELALKMIFSDQHRPTILWGYDADISHIYTLQTLIMGHMAIAKGTPKDDGRVTG